MILAKLELTQEELTIVVEAVGGGDCRVYVNGGFCPSGEAEKRFSNALAALDYATSVAKGVLEEEGY